MHQPVEPPDPDLPDEPGQSGLHSGESHPRAARCRCGATRTRRRIIRADLSGESVWFFCPACDLIPPMHGPTTKETP